MKDSNTRQYRAAKQAAVQTANSIVNSWRTGKCKTWQEVEQAYGIEIMEFFKNDPFTYANLSNFANWWIATFEKRLERSQTQESIRQTATHASNDIPCESWSNIKLFPEQQLVVDAIRREFSDTNFALYQNGGTGSGKTFIGLAWIAKMYFDKEHIQQSPIPGMFMGIPYIVITPKNVIVSWIRWAREFGLDDALDNGELFITSYSQLSSGYGQSFLLEEYDPITDKYSYKFNRALAPHAIIWDEAHRLNNINTKQTKFALALNDVSRPPKQLFLSATPWVKVNDSQAFVVATRGTFFDMRVTNANFKVFAGLLAKEPHKPNKEASKRLRTVLSRYIIPTPYVKWPHKAINAIRFVDFLSEEDKTFYAAAWKDYLEACRKIGKGEPGGPFMRMVYIQQLFKRVEPLRALQMVQLGLDAVKRGKSAVYAVSFRDSVITITYELIKLGIPRDQLCVIWGGKRQLDEAKLLTKEEQIELSVRIARGEDISPQDFRRLKETIEWTADRAMHRDATLEAQKARMAEYAKVSLAGTQSADQRQTEIDRFQFGEARHCIFTYAAGGVGLSLDHDKEILTPREVFLGPIWSGPQYKQGLGRCVRRTSLSDTYQYGIYMRGTVEETIAARVDLNMKCISEVAADDMNIMDFEEMPVNHKIRSVEEAEKDAEESKTQLHENFNDESDEEDED